MIAMPVSSAIRCSASVVGPGIGSAKSNVGHLITAAGGAGLLKVLGAMAAGIRPASLNADRELAELRGGPLRVVHQPEEIVHGRWMPLTELRAMAEDPASPLVPDGRRGILEWFRRYG